MKYLYHKQAVRSITISLLCSFIRSWDWDVTLMWICSCVVVALYHLLASESASALVSLSNKTDGAVHGITSRKMYTYVRAENSIFHAAN